ncbi:MULTISPECIES: XTP/dITP diphosphatase [Corallincola]|uniref:dITP/XTP pyrophosphatase n=2 Tax=Corallincola TaxID=1775176 RepID=A0ABY1WLJ7_9GAMM|nr:MULTISPECIES: XTP/dITP diphosphatase [Corallincola]TAA41769.1 XTP/dITP diphosphatase [Corallincola spongiicola]TCI02240.1 XTP/dITP diphosphatase [Corallincola luteus]
MQKIVLATGNQGKVKELNQMLAGLPFDVIAQSAFDVPDVAETGTTFVENAIIKARHAAKITGLPTIADDSGLEVDALFGAPGIYSSRYAGEPSNDSNNIDKLLLELSGKPAAERKARFQCVLVYMRHADDPTPVICQGTWQGEIAVARQGEQGFGYDPVFWVPTEQCMAAELSKQRKNHLSHRGQALKQLLAQLTQA